VVREQILKALHHVAAKANAAGYIVGKIELISQ